MKLPKLPVECIRRLFTKTGQSSLTRKFSRSVIPNAIVAGVLGLSDPGKYTIEELDELGILTTIIDATIYTCNEYNLTEEALELFDEIKSNYKALNYFILQINSLGQNLLKDPGVKQYILDTLIGPEWKEPDFYLYDDNILNLIIDENLRRKKNISSILCDGLCIFDNIPEGRINKFYDALRRLMPYFKRRGFYYTIGNEVRIYYKEEDFPISMPKLIKEHTHMVLYWYIENNQLIIEKEFSVYNYYHHVPDNEMADFLNRLKEKYPNNTLKEDSKRPYTYVDWYNKQEYNIPTDLEGVTNTFKKD